MTEDQNSKRDMLLELHKKGKWKEILAMYDDNFYDTRYIWIRPSEENLRFIGEVVRKLGANHIVSIGCGSGLLEWLIQEATGVDVTGVEVDPGWWNSKYAPPSFLPLKFVKQDEMATTSDNCVLLFCYFNNEQVFMKYLGTFNGKCVIIIGPGKDRGTHCNPEPFQLQGNPCWNLICYQEIRNTRDFIAVYTCLDLTET